MKIIIKKTHIHTYAQNVQLLENNALNLLVTLPLATDTVRCVARTEGAPDTTVAMVMEGTGS